MVKKSTRRYMPMDVSIAVLFVVLIMLRQYLIHATNISHSQHANPTFIIQAGNQAHGNRYLYDDYRETYYWMKQNTPKDSKILSWWDYGYQITGMSNRTVLVDNNTWNNTHIATVGKALISNEDEGHKICKDLDAKYVMVMFGGMAHYTGDDFSKFLWFVRIANSVFGGIREADYYPTDDGPWGPGGAISDKLRDSIAYKMMYYRFGEMYSSSGKPQGWDRARQVEIGFKDIHFKKFREVYTSKNWMLRVFEVLDEPNLAKAFVQDSKFDRGILRKPELEFAEESALHYSGGIEYGEAWKPIL